MNNIEIKFRAWDDKEKKWLMGYEYPSLGGFSMFGECMLFGEWEKVLTSRPLSDLREIKLMQFTGLLDKHGKNIYEGDLLKWNDSRIMEVMWGSVGWVLWSDLFISFGHPKGNDCSEFHTKSYCLQSEVIGNIYENPELIK